MEMMEQIAVMGQVWPVRDAAHVQRVKVSGEIVLNKTSWQYVARPYGDTTNSSQEERYLVLEIGIGG